MQNDFYDLLDRYNGGIEPLENWTTADLVTLIDAVDAELQNRAPPDGIIDAHYTEVNNAEEDDS